ncbi:lipopolysaccharide biosynthesis protein [Methanococcoides sp. AM1]|uniref:lipopolysaccharide biosynthesis protein n=1 Tax=Methanococcoides sp. AM1 TaxID=1201011 RepID=UPI001FCECDA1|nr:polysaccharide biosynthesis C-terminal domain-containing protein [Methanococcoides sp. AM1]
MQRIGLIGITNLIVSLSGIILLPILTKNIPIEEYGMWAQINVTIGIVPTVVLLGLPYTMVRFLPSIEKKRNVQDFFYSLFVIILITTSVTTILIYNFSETIASILFDSKIIIVKILSLIIFIESLNYFIISYYRATQQIKKYSILSFSKTCLSISLVSFYVLLGKGIIGATIGLLLASIIILIITYIFLISEIGIKIPRFSNLKEYLNFGVPTIPDTLSKWIVNSSDRYIIGILLGTAYVGYYSPGYSLGALISMFFVPLNFILPAVLSKSYDEGNLEEVKIILSYSMKYFLTIAIPCVFGISLLSRPILVALSTSEIASESYLITPFIALGTLLFGIYTIVQQIIILEKKTMILGKIWIISAILNIMLNFILIPYMGMMGAAITTVFAFTFSLIFVSYYSSKHLRFDINRRFIIKTILASLFMSLIILELNPKGLLDIIFSVGIGAAIYFVILFFLKGFENKEFNLLKEIIKV